MSTENQLKIPEPCHEDWKNFDVEGNKRFCHSCTKHVYDFTEMETHEIIDFLKGRSEKKTCGIFRAETITELTFKEKVKFNVKKYKKKPLKLTSVLAGLVFGMMMSFISSCTASPEERPVGKVNVHHTKHQVDSTQKGGVATPESTCTTDSSKTGVKSNIQSSCSSDTTHKEGSKPTPNPKIDRPVKMGEIALPKGNTSVQPPDIIHTVGEIRMEEPPKKD